MTEIQWLVEIMLHHKLPSQVRELFIARIGEVEARLINEKPRPIINVPMLPTQAPSTQRLLEDHVAPIRNPIPTEIVTSQGNGTMIKGPRKF